MTPQYSTSAALLFTEQELGGPCFEQEDNPTVTTTPSIVLQGAGDRVGLVIINLGANPCYIALTSSVSSTYGIFLAANGGLVTMTVRDDFTIPTRAYYGVSTGGNTTLYILELLRYRATPQG